MARTKNPWNGLGNSAVFDTHQYAQRAQDRPGKNKYKCVHYDPETGLCEMNNIGCVGPSNSLCPDYCTNPGHAKQPPNTNLRMARPAKSSNIPVIITRQQAPQKPAPQPRPQPKQIPPPKPKFDPATVSVGMMVKHINAGKGTVVKIDTVRKAITIRIDGIDTAFPFPESFIKGYLKVLPQDNR